MRSLAKLLVVLSVFATGCVPSISLEEAGEEAQPYLDGRELLFASRGVDLWINPHKFEAEQSGTISCDATVYATRDRLILHKFKSCREYVWKKYLGFWGKSVDLGNEAVVIPAQQVHVFPVRPWQVRFRFTYDNDRYMFRFPTMAEAQDDIDKSRELCLSLGLGGCEQIGR